MITFPGRGLTSYQAPLFISREQDLANKARQLKRISFVIYAGQIDQYISYLPAIQEKVVEALKVTNASPIYCQVFVMLRVLLLRFSASHLRSFWPTVVTELVRGWYITETPQLRVFAETVDPPLILAACKFLDLALILHTEEFHLYEWMFVCDVIDESVQQQQHKFVPAIEYMVQQQASSDISQQPTIVVDSSSRRKLLITVTQLSEKGQDFTVFVEHFLKQWRWHAHNNLVSSLPVDYESVYHNLEADFIEYS